MRNIFRIIFCFLIVFGAVILASFCFSPEASAWYLSLAKPDFTPPNWIYGPIWILIYILMAIALARISGIETNPACRRWYVAFSIQLLLNVLWSVLFFSFHALFLSLVDVVVLWFAVLVMTLQSHELDRLSFWLLLPYFAWITFAMMLTTGIWWLN